MPASWANLKYLSIFSLTGNSLTPGAILIDFEACVTVILSRMYITWAQGPVFFLLRLC